MRRRQAQKIARRHHSDRANLRWKAGTEHRALVVWAGWTMREEGISC